MRTRRTSFQYKTLQEACSMAQFLEKNGYISIEIRTLSHGSYKYVVNAIKEYREEK